MNPRSPLALSAGWRAALLPPLVERGWRAEPRGVFRRARRRPGPSTPAGLYVGGYELLSRLAAGGMGEVFVARPIGPGREQRIAIKLLLPHLATDPAFVQMFLDEARIAARMNHSNVVQILDLGEADGRYFIAMTLVRGVSLATLLRACRARNLLLPLPVVRLIARGLCEGLQHAHGLKGPDGQPYGIVHRDVSPQNILLSTSGAVRLTDFGIAKAHDNRYQTRTGEVRGKYEYMAPEQMRSDASVDHRADLFAAAATLFETYSLVSPFGRRTAPETIDAVRQAPVPDLLAIRPEVGPRVAAALRRALSRDPAERFPSALALGEALLDGEVADREELGRWVRELGAERLSVSEVPSTPLAPVTREMPAIASPRPAARPRWLAALVLALAVLASALVAWRFVPDRDVPLPSTGAPPERISLETLPVVATEEDPAGASLAPSSEPRGPVPAPVLPAGVRGPAFEPAAVRRERAGRSEQRAPGHAIGDRAMRQRQPDMRGQMSIGWDI